MYGAIPITQLNDFVFCPAAIYFHNQCCLSYKKLPEYIGFLIEDILQHKDEKFLFIQGYYRSFMKGKPVSSYRDFKLI